MLRSLALWVVALFFATVSAFAQQPNVPKKIKNNNPNLGLARPTSEDIIELRQVILAAGVPIYALPDTATKIVQRLPYGAKVRIAQPLPDRKVVWEGVRGYWMKVTKDSVTGFIPSPCLARNAVPHDRAMRYVMLYEGATCEQNFFDLKGQFAYGIYGSDAEGYQLRPTNVAYWGNEGSSPLFIRARGQSERSKLVLLSSQPMTATKIKAKFYDETAGAIDFGLLTIADANTNLQTVAEPEGANRDNWQRATLYAIDRTTFQKQVLTTVARATSPDDDSVFVPPYRLHFAGDLDGDGKPDFIISGESAFSAEERLFLSTLAKKGEMVGEAARWNYCMEK